MALIFPKQNGNGFVSKAKQMIIKFNNDFKLANKVEKGRANIICGAIDSIRLWWKRKIIIIKVEKKVERKALNQSPRKILPENNLPFRTLFPSMAVFLWWLKLWNLL